MTCQVLDGGYALSFVAQGGEELEEWCAGDIREVLNNAYMLSARNKKEVRVYLQTFVERNSASFGHRVTVLPGDTANGLETRYSATVYMCNENEASIENAVETLRKTLATNPADASPSERWLVVVTGLMRSFGREAIDTKITLESRVRVDEITTDIIYEIKGRAVWAGNGFSFHDTEDMYLKTVVEEIKANVALMEEKLHQESGDQFWGPVSSVRFWYHTYGIRWGIVVTFLYGKHTRISAQSDEIVVETRMGNTMMTNRVHSVPGAFAFTRESWERALRTAVSVSNADITGVMERLEENKWGRVIFPGLWKK